jgi:uncharacterized protein YjcR
MIRIFVSKKLYLNGENMDYFTVKQISDNLGVSEVTVRRWLEQDLLPKASKENNIRMGNPCE